MKQTLSNYGPVTGWQTRAETTGELGSAVRNQVANFLFESAITLGHCDPKSFTIDCAFCPRTVEMDDVDLAHLVAASLGGYAHAMNLALACKRCNNRSKLINMSNRLTYDVRPLWTGVLPLDKTNPRICPTWEMNPER